MVEMTRETKELQSYVEGKIGKELEFGATEPALSHRFLDPVQAQNAQKVLNLLATRAGWRWNNAAGVESWAGGNNDRVALYHFDADGWRKIPDSAYETPITELGDLHRGQNIQQAIGHILSRDRGYENKMNHKKDAVVSALRNLHYEVDLVKTQNEKVDKIVIYMDNEQEARSLEHALHFNGTGGSISVDNRVFFANASKHNGRNVVEINPLLLHKANISGVDDSDTQAVTNYISSIAGRHNTAQIQLAARAKDDIEALEARLGLKEVGLKIERDGKRWVIRAEQDGKHVLNHGQPHELEAKLNAMMKDVTLDGDISGKSKFAHVIGKYEPLTSGKDERVIVIDERFLAKKPASKIEGGDIIDIRKFVAVKLRQDKDSIIEAFGEGIEKSDQNAIAARKAATDAQALLDKAIATQKSESKPIEIVKLELEKVKLEIERLTREEERLTKLANKEKSEEAEKTAQADKQKVKAPKGEQFVSTTVPSERSEDELAAAKEAQTKLADDLAKIRTDILTGQQKKLDEETKLASLEQRREKLDSAIESMRAQVAIANEKAKLAEEQVAGLKADVKKADKVASSVEAAQQQAMVATKIATSDESKSAAENAYGETQKIFKTSFAPTDKAAAPQLAADAPATPVVPGATTEPATTNPAAPATTAPVAPLNPGAPAAAPVTGAPATASPGTPATAAALAAGTPAATAPAPTAPAPDLEAGDMAKIGRDKSMLESNMFAMLAGAGGLLGMIFMGIDPIIAAVGAVVMAVVASVIGDRADGFMSNFLPESIVGKKEPTQGQVVQLEKDGAAAQSFSVSFGADGKITDKDKAAYELNGALSADKKSFVPTTASIVGDPRFQSNIKVNIEALPVVDTVDPQTGEKRYVVPGNVDLTKVATGLNDTVKKFGAPPKPEAAKTAGTFEQYDKDNNKAIDDAEMKGLDKTGREDLFKKIMSEAVQQQSSGSVNTEVNNDIITKITLGELKPNTPAAPPPQTAEPEKPAPGR